MGMATSLVALALLGSDPTPILLPPALAVESVDEITCQMQMTTVEGLAWRSAAYGRLKSVGQKGASTVWTADRSFKADMTGGKDAQFQTVAAPRVTTFAGMTGTVLNRGPFQYIGDVERIADGPINQATQVVYAPKGTSVEIGFTSEFEARRLDQGVLARIKVAETHISTIHRIGVTELVYPPQADVSTALTPAGKQIFQHFIKADAATVSAPLMLPEVATSEVAGEWLVPDDSVLVISMGIDTVTNAQGNSVVQERLAIYDFARPSDTARSATKATALGKPIHEIVTFEIAPTKSAPAAEFDLPPLPEAYAAADLNTIEPGSPRATTEPITTAHRSTDPHLARTKLQPIADSELELLNSQTLPAITALPDGCAVIDPTVPELVGAWTRFCVDRLPISATGATLLRLVEAALATEIDDDDATPAIASNGLSMPRVPDRSAAADDLPPLPEGYASADLDRIKPGSPLASPQPMTAGRAERSISDSQVTRTGLMKIPANELEASIATPRSAADAITLPQITVNADGQATIDPTLPALVVSRAALQAAMLRIEARESLQSAPAQPEPVPLATLVAAFLRSGMATPTAPDPILATSGLSMPRVPDRSYPVGIAPDGAVVDLPALPEGYASADLDQISPGTPLASPQSVKVAQASRPMVDPHLARTSFPPENVVAVVNGEPITRSQLRDEQSCSRPNDATLTTMIESFLRQGMKTAGRPDSGTFPSLPVTDQDRPEPFPNRTHADIVTETDESGTGKITCPAAAQCPYSAEGCDAKDQAAATASKIEMGVSVRDGKGTCVYNSEDDLVAALQTPGKAEIKFIPLGGNMSLQIEAKVVPTPKAQQAASQRTAYKPKRVAELLYEADILRTGVEDLDAVRFWFLDQPSHMTPFGTHGGQRSAQPAELGDPYDTEPPSDPRTRNIVEPAATVIPIPLAEKPTGGSTTFWEMAEKRRLDIYQKHDLRFLDTRNGLTPAPSNGKSPR